jgi:hypothetical protein
MRSFLVVILSESEGSDFNEVRELYVRFFGVASERFADSSSLAAPQNDNIDRTDDPKSGIAT